MQFQPGQRIGKNGDDKYEVVSNIHDGSMSEVYVVNNVDLFGKPFVLKTLPLYKIVSSQDLQEALQRFEQEAKILADLSHPKIVKIFDYFNAKDVLGNSLQCIVMNYVEGEDLGWYLQRNGIFSEDDTRKYALEILEGVDYLHTRKPPIIFRDMKPSNVVRGLDDHLTLIDFGIAKGFQGQQQGTKIGTPEFAAPEQFDGNATLLSDIYGVGTTIYALLTGEGQSMAVLTGKASIPTLLRNKRSDVSPDLVDIVKTATQVDPVKRYQSARDMMQALNRQPISISSITATASARTQIKTATTKIKVPAQGIKQVHNSGIGGYDPNVPHTIDIVRRETYGEALDELVCKCSSSAGSLQPVMKSTGKARPLTFRETLLARIYGHNRGDDHLFNTYLDSCTGIVRSGVDVSKFKIIPICRELIKLHANFSASDISLTDSEYSSLQFPELDRRNAKYDEGFNDIDEIVNHEGWLAAVENDKQTLRKYAEIVDGKVMKRKKMGFYLPGRSYGLRALYVYDIGDHSSASGSSGLSGSACFVRVNSL